MSTINASLRTQLINDDWIFCEGMYGAFKAMLGGGTTGETVNLPHDYMIAQDPSESAPAGPAMGYFEGKVANYTKYFEIPGEWEGDQVLVHFDGVMMNAAVDINGATAAVHHYGYTPFDVDITKYIYYGEKNRLTVTCNPSMQPNHRWYSGAGIYRDVTLVHRPGLHIATDGIFARTEYAANGTARVLAEVTIENGTREDRIVRVETELVPETFEGESLKRNTSLLVKAGMRETARIPMTVKNPVLWDARHPELYMLKAFMKEEGTFGAALKEAEDPIVDFEETLFGIRTIRVSSEEGLLINEKPVKLAGGCIHHDNGVLGAASFYDAEARKLLKMKELGYNAVRLAHNPPSRATLEVCDRLGMYVFDEAFDAWGTAKQPGDYSQFFKSDWKDDIRSFVLRDRNHPSVILWSTGNEIPERGGLGEGYALAYELSNYMRELDPSRLITNGLCSYWSGLDDKSNAEFARKLQETLSSGGTLQNASTGGEDTSWEERSEAFVSNLDVVGYNYMDDHYEPDHRMYPERVIVGTESYPNKMESVWNLTVNNSHVIGDFTWTSCDYLGEAGIGKSAFLNPDDPGLNNPWLMQSHSSVYPWRLGNDADLTINGEVTPQGSFRKLIFGGEGTFLYVQDPKNFGLTEVISPWGWEDVEANWNWKEAEGKPVKVVVYSSEEEVELFLNGESLGVRAAGKDHHFKAEFTAEYKPGRLEAVGRKGTKASLATTGEPAALRLVPEKEELAADGSSLAYVKVEVVDAKGDVVPDAEVLLEASAQGAGALQGFGSDAPKTAENYTKGKFTSYRGKACAVIRAAKEAGEVTLKVGGGSFEEAVIRIKVSSRTGYSD